MDSAVIDVLINIIENIPSPRSSIIQDEPSKAPKVIDELIQIVLNNPDDIFKEFDSDTIGTNHSPPLNIERASSFHFMILLMC